MKSTYLENLFGFDHMILFLSQLHCNTHVAYQKSHNVFITIEKQNGSPLIFTYNVGEGWGIFGVE